MEPDRDDTFTLFIFSFKKCLFIDVGLIYEVSLDPAMQVQGDSQHCDYP
jgi:hypothetical protein